MRNRLFIASLVISMVLPLALTASAASSQEDAVLQQLRADIQAKGLTYEVAANPATKYSIDQICGLNPPDKWWVEAPTQEMQTSGLLGLPTAYDARDYGLVSPVKNQGSCGSCWAFSTVEALESRILKDGGPVTDLSEQYLVSCNDDGWGCNGGWFAHDYHVKDGAVYESCRPYTASDTACQCTCSHPYKLTGWYYINGQNSVPSTDSIKNAIYNYGPVACAVYVDSGFQYYSSGVFNGTASGQVNHAVFLVGWNDAGGYWIMKNSWGTGWGESGYMRIAYGSQLIGYAANYLTGSTSGSWPADSDCSGGCTAGMTTNTEALTTLMGLVNDNPKSANLSIINRITRDHEKEIEGIMARNTMARHLVQRGLWTNLGAIQTLAKSGASSQLDMSDFLRAIDYVKPQASPQLARDLDQLELVLTQLDSQPSSELVK